MTRAKTHYNLIYNSSLTYSSSSTTNAPMFPLGTPVVRFVLSIWTILIPPEMCETQTMLLPASPSILSTYRSKVALVCT